MTRHETFEFIFEYRMIKDPNDYDFVASFLSSPNFDTNSFH